MNECIEIIKKRRSTRSFQASMPPAALVREVVEVGLYAPCSMDSESTRIIVITDKDLRQKLSELNCSLGYWRKGFDPFYGAPVIILVVADKDDVNHVYNGSVQLMTMMLAAESLGLQTCWVHRAKEEMEKPLGQEILSRAGIFFRPGQFAGIGHLAIGYGAEEPAPPAPRKEGRISYIS